MVAGGFAPAKKLPFDELSRDANASTTTNYFGPVPLGPDILDAPFSTTTTPIPVKLGQCEYTTPPYMHAREHEKLRTHSNLTH